MLGGDPKENNKSRSLKPIESNCTRSMQKICEQLQCYEGERPVISDP